MSHPNEAFVRRQLDAFAQGDMDAVQSGLADDVTLHSPGRWPLAGTYRGKKEVLGFFGQLFELTEGTFHFEVHDVLANDEHVIWLLNERAERQKRKLEWNGIGVAHIRNGKLAEIWLHDLDQFAVEEFYS